MKKLLSMMSAAALAATCFAVPAFAAEPAAITVSSDSNAVGKTVTVNVSISGNTEGFVSYDMALDYNSEALELTSIAGGEKSSGGMFVGEVATGKAGFMSSSKVTGDGVLFSATFEIKEGASGDQSVSVKNVTLTDANYGNTAAGFPVSPGTVTVSSGDDQAGGSTADGDDQAGGSTADGDDQTGGSTADGDDQAGDSTADDSTAATGGSDDQAADNLAQTGDSAVVAAAFAVVAAAAVGAAGFAFRKLRNVA